jgi:hypothetical protein
MAIDAAEGFKGLTDIWYRAPLRSGQGFWHAGNTLDTIVTYLVQTKQKDSQVKFVSTGLDIFRTSRGLHSDDPPGPGTPERPAWWRDDYGWWAIALLNAYDNASILGLDENTKQGCIAVADLCWDIMNYDWGKNNGNGVRNNPIDGGDAQTNTITNVLFMLLGVRRYQVQKDAAALDTAMKVFDWFYNARPTESGKNGLFNSKGLIRYWPSHDEDDRAWTGDQGWFWRTCLELRTLNHDATRRTQIIEVLAKLSTAVLTNGNVFQNKVVVEISDKYKNNFDIDFATGKGVFMRQFAIINVINDNRFPPQWGDRIQASAQGHGTIQAGTTTPMPTRTCRPTAGSQIRKTTSTKRLPRLPFGNSRQELRLRTPLMRS